jgi:hypothetical protein
MTNVLNFEAYLVVALQDFGAAEHAEQIASNICHKLVTFDSFCIPSGKSYYSDNARSQTENFECWRLSHFITDVVQKSGLKLFEDYNSAQTFGYCHAVVVFPKYNVIRIRDKNFYTSFS